MKRCCFRLIEQPATTPRILQGESERATFCETWGKCHVSKRVKSRSPELALHMLQFTFVSDRITVVANSTAGDFVNDGRLTE